MGPHVGGGEANPLTLGVLLGSRVPYHVGIAVHDIDGSIAKYRDLLGLAVWARRETSTHRVFRGIANEHSVSIAVARWGQVFLELAAPVRGESPVSEFLTSHNEGVSHLGYFVEDLDDVVSVLPSSCDVMMTNRNEEGLVAVYLDTLEDLGFYVELVNSARREGFLSWVQDAT